ncbi:hypothetical protein AAVH_11903 [Aphelenchoides avenae]|nr:hypothetical protein AAVH_11903 [Aphelenchus avenae]
MTTNRLGGMAENMAGTARMGWAAADRSRVEAAKTAAAEVAEVVAGVAVEAAKVAGKGRRGSSLRECIRRIRSSHHPHTG